MLEPVTLLAGVPATNATLFHQTNLVVGDAVAYLANLPPDGESLLLVRDIELPRAREAGRADVVACAQDFEPPGGLSGDRDVATAQAIVEVLRRRGVVQVVTDRTLPFLYASHLQLAGIHLELDDDLGVMARRVKTAAEIKALEYAQKVTGQAMTMACRLIARADTNGAGELVVDGQVLTSERVRRRITSWLIDQGFSNSGGSIVATVPHVSDCHHMGTGPLKTGLPVIVDIFPRDDSTRYHGDCTRTVVHGTPTDEVARMHKAVAEAKRAACEALRPGTTGDKVHKATIATLEQYGYEYVPGSREHDEEVPAMRHGTGHGVGLDVHEPILLSLEGGEILAGEVVTVEPGLYSSTLGGIRVEDMAHVTEDGAVILSPLYEGLDWSEVE